MRRLTNDPARERRANRLTSFSLLAVLCTACGGPTSSPEEQVRRWIAVAQEAAEEKQRSALIDMISPAYADSRGNKRHDIENMLRVYFLRQHSVGLLANIEEIRMFGNTAAEVDLTVGMAGSNDGVLGFSADAYQFALELESDAGEWRLIAARWAGLGEELR